MPGGVSAAGGYALWVDTIDWRAAQWIGERVAGSPPRGEVQTGSVQPLADEFAQRVSAYSGLVAPPELPALETVDRPAWIAANLKTMRPIVGPLSERLGDGLGPFSGPLRSLSGYVLGAQIGALTGLLSQRVLGQYDLALLEEGVEPRLLLLAPNLAITARTLHVDEQELVRWVAIHEITHAVQFTAVPWLRGHMGAMLKELLDGLQTAVAPGSRASRAEGAEHHGGTARAGGRCGGLLGRLPDAASLRLVLERARRGEVLRLTIGEERWALVESLQTAMSLIEGHAEHTMDAVGAELLPSLPRLRAAMNRRRASHGLPWRVLERLLGLELKLRQYELGRRFCDAVVEREGRQALALVWRAPESMPSARELLYPAEWLARVGAAA